MINKILWLSGFADVPSKSQIRDLRRRFGRDVQVDQRSINNAKKQAEMLFSGRYAAAVAVMPLTNLDYLLRLIKDRPIPLLYAQTEPESNPDRIEFRSTEGHGRRFTHFSEVDRIVLTYSPIEPREIRLLVRFSSQKPDEAESAALQYLFGRKVEIVTDSNRFQGANELLDRMAALGAEEMLPRAPIGILRNLIRRHVLPLQLEMQGGITTSIHRLTGVELTYRN